MYCKTGGGNYINFGRSGQQQDTDHNKQNSHVIYKKYEDPLTKTPHQYKPTHYHSSKHKHHYIYFGKNNVSDLTSHRTGSKESKDLPRTHNKQLVKLKDKPVKQSVNLPAVETPDRYCVRSCKKPAVLVMSTAAEGLTGGGASGNKTQTNNSGAAEG